MSAFDLHGKTAVVTGGNSGIGFAFANGIAKAGGDVAIWGRRADVNEEAAALLRAHGTCVVAQQVDVSDELQVAEAMAAAAGELGRIDCVVANAGAYSTPPAFHELATDDYHDLLATAQHGVFFTLREAVRHMVARAERGDPGGSLIVTGSLTVKLGYPLMQHYGAAKSAALAMVRGIAVEYGRHGIRANMVAPGYFETPLLDDAVAADRNGYYRGRTPMARNGRPADLEGIAVYLMSDAAAFHTGDLIVIDGGLSIAGRILE